MSTLYVGNLPPNVSTRELRSLVSKYGRVHRIESKGSFAFLVSVPLSDDYVQCEH